MYSENLLTYHVVKWVVLGLLFLIVILYKSNKRSRVDRLSRILNENGTTDDDTTTPTERRNDFFTRSYFRRRKVKYLLPRKGIDYERWGRYIFDPDVSQIDYNKLRENDHTLPKVDPRTLEPYSLGHYEMEPSRKWLYFSDDLGSFEKRRDLLRMKGYSVKKERIMKKVNPDLLRTSQRYETDYYFNIDRLNQQVPEMIYDLKIVSLLFVPFRYMIGVILLFFYKLDTGQI